MKNSSLTSFRLLVTAVILLLGGAARAQYTIKYQNSDASNGALQRVAVDGGGNSFYTGTFGDSIHLGSITVYKSFSTTGPSSQYFVAKMDAAGNWVWGKSIPVTPLGVGSAAINIGNVTADNSGNAYITGSFRGTAVFGGTTLKSGATASNNNSLFVAKMNSSGSFVWAVSKAPKGGYDAWGRGITTDASGNVYVTGRMGVKAGSPTINGIYWAKYSSSGVTLWENTLSPSSGSYPASYSDIINQGNEIAVDGSGNAYITGDFHGSVKFANGSGLTVSSTTPAAFTTKLNGSGAVQWVRVAIPSTPNGTSNPNAYSTGLYVDGTGDIYIGGHYLGANLIFTGSSSVLLNPTSTNYGFLAKYSSAGVLAWAVTTTDSMNTRALFRQPSGNVGMVASRKGSAIISEYNSSGSLVSSTASTGGFVTGNLLFQDAAATSSGYILCGSVWGTMGLGSLTLTGACSFPLGGDCNHSDMLIVNYTDGYGKPSGLESVSVSTRMLVYPNPVKDILYLNNNEGNAIGNTILCDQTGRKVLMQKINGNKGEIDMKQLASGIYFLKTEHSGVIRIIKVN